MRSFSKKPVVWGVLKSTPLLLLLLLMVVTCLARARPAKAASKDFEAFCWDTRSAFKNHACGNSRDSNGFRYGDYDADFNLSDYRLRVGGKKIDLRKRCDDEIHEDAKEGTVPPYRYWFWVKGNKLRSSGIHWSTDYFVATSKALTRHGSKGYDVDQYEKDGDGCRINRLDAKKGYFWRSKGKVLKNSNGRFGMSFYVVDIKPWYDHNYEKLSDNFHGNVYLSTVASIYDKNERRLGGPYRTLKAWTDAANGKGFASNGVDDYPDHYNQVLPVLKTIKHTFRLYRMHTSREHPVAGKVTNEGEPDKSSKFKSWKIGEKDLKAGSVMKFDNSILKYEENGKQYYLKGIREFYIDEYGKAQNYAKFMILDSLNDEPVTGTDKSTDEYTKVGSNSVEKRDSISPKDLYFYKMYKLSVGKNGFSASVISANNNVKNDYGGESKNGITGRKKWAQIADYMTGCRWKNGIKENRIFLVYQEIPSKSRIKVYNKIYKHVDGKESDYVCDSGATTPVYTEEMQNSSGNLTVNLNQIQDRSKAARKPDEKGCAVRYKTLNDMKYFAKSITVKYADSNGNDAEKTFSVKDYYYNTATGAVGRAGASFSETDVKKQYSINTGHKDTEKALKAITERMRDDVKFTAGRSKDVKIYVNYYQPKVPNVALIYRRSYDSEGKAVDTLVKTEKLGNTLINSTSKKATFEGKYGPYPAELTFTKDSQGKWSITEGQSSSEGSEADTLPLIEETVYKSDVKNYHGATSDSWSGNGLKEKTKCSVSKDGDKHSITYRTVFRGNAVKLVYGEALASYTYNVYYAERINGVLSPWALGKSVTKAVNTYPEEELKRTRELEFNDTLAGMGVSVLKPDLMLLP